MLKQYQYSKLADNTLNVEADSHYKIDFDENGILFFNVLDINNLNIEIIVKENINARIIFWNEGRFDLNISEKYTLERSSYLNLIYGELSDAKVKRHMEADLYEGSEILVDGATIATNTNKDQTFIANHKGKYTTSNLNNYGIIGSGGYYNLDVIGHILEKAVGSKAHQDSKLLTVSEDQTTKVTPYLYIYENDVEASHAATVGQIDENQLYYMQARGLSEMEAVALVMSGYLMPIARAIEDVDLSEHVKKLINSKVDAICLATTN